MTNLSHMPAPELVTTTEAAAELGVAVKTITRMVEDGRLTPQQKLPGIRGTYLFERAEIDRAKDERAAELAAELQRLKAAPQ